MSELTMDELTERFYQLKAHRDRLLWAAQFAIESGSLPEGVFSRLVEALRFDSASKDHAPPGTWYVETAFVEPGIWIVDRRDTSIVARVYEQGGAGIRIAEFIATALQGFCIDEAGFAPAGKNSEKSS